MLVTVTVIFRELVHWKGSKKCRLDFRMTVYLPCWLLLRLFSGTWCIGSVQTSVVYSIPLYSTLPCCTLLYSTLLYFTLLYSTLLYSTLLYCTLLVATLLYSTLLYSILFYSTLLYSALLDATLLYSTWLYSTLLDSYIGSFATKLRTDATRHISGISFFVSLRSLNQIVTF